MFSTKSPSILWDGTFKGEPVISGVYVYKLNVFYIDGNTEVKKGTVTIVR